MGLVRQVLARLLGNKLWSQKSVISLLTLSLVLNSVESALHCVATTNPSSWCHHHLSSVEYTHNIFTCSATRLSPFKASLGYQPSLLSSHDLSDCSSAPHPCRETWRTAKSWCAPRTPAGTYCHGQQAPSYQTSQLVWPSIRNILLVTKRPVKSLPTSSVPSPLKRLSIPFPSIWHWMRP